MGYKFHISASMNIRLSSSFRRSYVTSPAFPDGVPYVRITIADNKFKLYAYRTLQQNNDRGGLS